jgi:hypothetical protein
MMEILRCGVDVTFPGEVVVNGDGGTMGAGSLE